eukprot:jgi/Psemu1/241785/estExt_Genewise1.C_2450046
MLLDGDSNVNYEDRLQREEVFSKLYHPNNEEKKELRNLAESFKVKPSMISSMIPSVFQVFESQAILQQLIFGNHSIILKKGLMTFNGRNCDLILLTDGFIAAYHELSVYDPLGSHKCQFWSDVEFTEVNDSVGELTIQMDSGESYKIRSHADGEDLKCWQKTIEKVLLLSAIHGKKINTDLLGWEYTIIRKPAYTTAVTGDMTLMKNSEGLNELDHYNKSSPLHYALQQKPCNANIVDAFLRFGADPNLEDGEGRSAMYFAERDQLSDIEKMLRNNGGKKSFLAETELNGELFGAVKEAAFNVEVAKANKAAEAAAKAQSAQSQMSQNMAAMLIRGEKIKEVDDKAQELNEEAEQFGNAASQLKDLVMKKW